MTNLGERIRALATGQAAFFRLKMQLTDNSVRVFPPEEGGYYKVGESPHPIPVGSYLLCFYDSEHRSIVNSDQRFIVHPQADLLRAAQGLQGQLPLNFNLAGSPSGSGAAHPASSPPAPPATVVVAPPSLAAPAGKPSEVAAGAEVDLEFRKHLHAMDLEERQQDFIRNSTYVKEVGELFMLNRLMRRDMMEMQRSMVMHAQHAFRDIEQVKTTIQGLLDLEIKVVSHVESRLSRPPVPPPDYVGLGNSALSLLKEVSVALIQRGQPERPGSLPAAPQLPAASYTAAPDTTPPAERQPPSGVLERIKHKLGTLTELDLAQAMSSPESWAALFQSVLRPETAAEEGAKATSPTPSPGAGG